MTPTPKPTATPPGMTPTPVTTQTPRPTQPPTSTPSPVHTPTPIPTSTPTPAPGVTYEPPDPKSAIVSTYGTLGLAQIFDLFPGTDPQKDTQMSTSQISQDATRYNFVWGSFPPRPQYWRSANPNAAVSRYYIATEDNILVSGNDMTYFQQNHPDWILYACDSGGNPTSDFAYTPGDGFADVPLDLHNPAVVQYMMQSLVGYARANGYNALALDQILFKNPMLGGNPNFGQTVKPGEFGCGVNRNGQFVKEYQSPADATWTTDILNLVAVAKQYAGQNGLLLAVNHPIGSAGDPNEQTLLNSIDVSVDEVGFSDYGNYTKTNSLFNSTYNYAENIERQGKALVVIDKFASYVTLPASAVEYSIATYLMVNEGNLDLFAVGDNGQGYGYGAEQYHQEYANAFGRPCAPMYGDSSNPQVYYRRYEHGLSIVNSGSGTGNATLPAGHTYVDIEGRAVSNPLPLGPHDSYALTTSTNGCT